MGENVEGMSTGYAAKKCIEAVENLIRDLGLPTTPKAIGIKKEGLSAVAKSAAETCEVPGNPRTTKALAQMHIVRAKANETPLLFHYLWTP